jgi:Leucine-rich repeat (LRR) protein
MSDKTDQNQSGLISVGNKTLATRSSALVKRGLEALASPQPRMVCFPIDRSLGNYIIFDCDKFDPVRHPETFPFSQSAKAKGVVNIPPGKMLYLEIKYNPDLFTFSEDLVAFSRLKPDDVHTISINNFYGGLERERLAILQCLTGLQGFVLSSDISDAALVQRRHLPHLQELSLRGSSDAGLVHLEGLTELKFLDLSDPLTSYLVPGSFPSGILDAGLAYLRHLPHLQELSLRGRKISDAGFAHIEGLVQLHSLDLARTNITDNRLTHIAGINTLQHLDLSYTPVSNSGIDSIRRALPNCIISSNKR